MSHKIPLQCVIASYFDEHKDKENASFKEIYDFKEKIIKSFEKKKMLVFVNFRRDEIINTININPEIFECELDKGKMVCKNRKLLEREVKWYFNPCIPYEIRDHYLRAVKQVLEEEKPA